MKMSYFSPLHSWTSRVQGIKNSKLLSGHTQPSEGMAISDWDLMNSIQGKMQILWGINLIQFLGHLF